MLKRYSTLAALAALPLALCAQNKRYVNPQATGANDGSSWANAHTDLGAALAAAGSADTLLLREGVYVAPRTGFRFTEGAALVGGFEGREAYASQADPRAFPTVLSGDADGDDPEELAEANFISDARLGDNAEVILRVTADGGGKLVEGLAIERSYTPFSTGRGDVAGVVVTHDIAGAGSPERSEVTFRRCLLRRHAHRVGSVFETGGGYDPGDVALTRFDRCTVTDNYALAALFAMDDATVDGAQEHLVVTDSEIVGNRFVVTGNSNARVTNGDVFALFWNASANRRTDKRLAIANSTVADNRHLDDEDPVTGSRGVINADYANQATGPRDATAIQIAIVNSVFGAYDPKTLVYNPRGFDVGRSYFFNNNLAGRLVGGASPSTDFVDTVTAANETIADQLARTTTFLDAAQGGFQLLPCGDGVDVGAADLSALAGTDFDYLPAMAAAATDLTGRPRVSGSAQDRGAYEGPYDDGLLAFVGAPDNMLRVNPPLPSGRARYSLIDCGAGAFVVQDTVASMFKPTADGDYHVRVTYTGAAAGTCIWQTPCVAYETGTSSVGDALVTGVTLAPNPAGAYLTVEAPTPIREARVYDLAGRLLDAQPAAGGLVHTAALAPGTYVLVLVLADDRRAVERFVRQ